MVAIAIFILRFIPPDKEDTSSSFLSVKCNFSRIFNILSFKSFFGISYIFPIIYKFSKQVRLFHSTTSWGQIPISFSSRYEESFPLNNIFPLVGFNNPTIILIEVLFPAPFGPKNPNISPFLISKDRLFTTATSSYFLTTFCSSIKVSDIILTFSYNLTMY